MTLPFPFHLVAQALRLGEHRNAIRFISCPRCGKTIDAARYELHMLLCKQREAADAK